jgi:hypothetical protein
MVLVGLLRISTPRIVILLLVCNVVNAKFPLISPDFNLTSHYSKYRRSIQIKEGYHWCQNGLHVVGKWVFNPNAKKSFPCCSYEKADYNWNKTLCGSSTMADASVSGLSMGTAFNQLGGNACTCDRTLGRLEINPFQKYSWTANYCSLVDFDAQYFCELLGPRRIIFIGDSTFLQTGATLMNLVRSQHGNCLENILFAHANHLWQVDRQMNWIEIIEYHDPQIVVFGFGAHDKSVEQFMDDWTKSMKMLDEFMLKRTALIHDRKLSWLPIKMVFKTQNPGHLHCENYTAPLSSPPFIDNSPDDRYLWGHFDLFDKLGKEFAYKRNMSVLDMFPLALRPDGHPTLRDCLHFCAPGPLDIIGTLILTMLHTGEL